MALGFGFGLPQAAAVPSGPVPSLYLQFLDSTTLDPRITFTRNSIGTYFNSAGLLQTAGNNVARFDYNPATLAARGLLIEEQRTNLLLQSRDMTQAAWGKTDVTATRNQVGLDGVANTACLMTEGSAGTAATTQTSTTAVTAGSTFSASLVMKRGNTDWIRIYLRDVGDGVVGWFNLSTGAKGTTTATGVATNVSSSIVSLGGGWYRCIVTCTPNGTVTNGRVDFYAVNSDNSTTRVSGATYTVDCAQLEVGAFATSIIPTTTATVTRLADSAVMTGTNFSSWYNASAGAFFSESSSYAPTTSSAVINRTDAGNTDLLFGGLTIARSRDNVPTTINSNVFTTVLANQPVKMAMSYQTGVGRSVTGQGLTPVDGTYDGTYSTIVGIRLGQNGGATTYLNGHIRRITYYPTRLPNATLQALTA